MDRLERLVAPARSPLADPALVVLCHGLGSHEEDLFGLAPDLDPRAAVVCLRAPLEYAFGGYAWFDVNWDETGLSFSVESAIQAIDVLAAEVAVLADELGVAAERVVLGGFSQGAMVSLGALLRHPGAVGGTMLWSGACAPGMEPRGEVQRAPVFQSHGRLDPVLPVAQGRQVHALLANLGAEVEYHEYPMAHEISPACLRDSSLWLAKWLDRLDRP